MGSIFNTLNIGYSGLNVAQVGVNTTSQNISNAETEGYSRQRVVVEAATPLALAPGNVGNGAAIMDIKRIFDNFVFDRYTKISSDKEYADFSEKTLNELSTYFPEIDGVGIKSDLTEYYNMWQTLANNPDNDSIKLALAEQAKVLAQNIGYTQDKVYALQSQVNEQLLVNINEVNELTSQLAEVNGAIEKAESGGGYSANDLRDKRNTLERSLIRLIGGDVSNANLSSNIQFNSSSNTVTGSYTFNINGFNIVDGQTSHNIHIDNKDNANKFYELSFERQDGKLIPMDESISGGIIGSILDLRGTSELRSGDGVPADGILQDIITQMNSFAIGLIEGTNNLYAQNSTDKMTSNILEINPNNSLVNSNLNIHIGTFDIVVYDIDGNTVASREITINEATSMSGLIGTNSIEGQILNNFDDNNNGSGLDDVDDFLLFNWATYASGDTAMELFMNPGHVAAGYSFAIKDNSDDGDFADGTNFAGSLGLSRFFDGYNAHNIELTSPFKGNPTLISGGKAPVSGDNTLALDMVQQQFEKYDFDIGNITYNVTMYGMFDIIATDVGTKTNSAILYNESISAQFNATELEYYGISKVSIDEEMTNLIKYQTSYGAAAKVITTVDQMMETLLGIKR